MTSTSMYTGYHAKALRKLSVLATEAKTVIELALCHGAVIVIAYRADRGQQGQVLPNDIAIYLADAVGEEMRLRNDWLKTGLAHLLAEASAGHGLREREFAPGIVLSVNGTARVLAQKLHLLRDNLPPHATDERDAEFLLTKISVSAPEQIRHIYSRVFPGIPICDHAHQVIDHAFHERLVANS